MTTVFLEALNKNCQDDVSFFHTVGVVLPHLPVYRCSRPSLESGQHGQEETSNKRMRTFRVSVGLDVRPVGRLRDRAEGDELVERDLLAVERGEVARSLGSDLLLGLRAHHGVLAVEEVRLLVERFAHERARRRGVARGKLEDALAVLLHVEAGRGHRDAREGRRRALGHVPVQWQAEEQLVRRKAGLGPLRESRLCARLWLTRCATKVAQGRVWARGRRRACAQAQSLIGTEEED